MRIVVPSSVTPTRFGIEQTLESGEGWLRVIAMCCGSGGWMLYTSGDGDTEVQCKKCEEIHPNISSRLAKGTRIETSASTRRIAEWVSHWTGWDLSELKVDITTGP